MLLFDCYLCLVNWLLAEIMNKLQALAKIIAFLNAPGVHDPTSRNALQDIYNMMNAAC